MISVKRPNVLLIYTDQQRLDTLSCVTKDAAIQTKNMDAIAQNGVLFDHCFTQSPICAPSRMSFLTGRYCSSIGVGTNGIAFPEHTAVPVHRILKDYGYETAQLGKIHFLPHAKRDAREMYNAYGFDRAIISDEPGCYDDPYTKWVEMVKPDQLSKVRTSLPPAAYQYGKPEYSDVPRNTHEPYVFEGDDDVTHSAFVTSEVCKFLKERDKNKPFFAIAGFYAPHPPINPPKSCIDRVDLSKIKLPVMGEQEKMMPDLKDLTENDWRKIVQYYLALTLHVDDCVGEILSTLKETGEEDNTIVIFTADHGEYLGDHKRVQKGMPGYDCITNVPMIISYPKKIKKGSRYCGLIESVDIVPTVLDYCGVQTPPFVQGKSLVPVLSGKCEAHRDTVFTENFVPYGVKETTVRTLTHKYYCNSKGQEMLFDLVKDKDELINVIDQPEYADVLSELRKQMILRIQMAAYPNLEREAEY